MTLLSLERVGKRYRRGLREHVVLRDVSLELDRGELVVVWGMRRSGRSTLLRVAAGVEAPDRGIVRFEGRDLAACVWTVMGGGIGYCRRRIAATDGSLILEHVMAGLLARGVPRTQSRSHARAALERAGVEQCAALGPHDLDSAELVRVAIARANVLCPALLVIDEPTKGVDLLERDQILLLLRSLAEEGITVLASTGDGTGLAGAHRALALGEGELRGDRIPGLAPVVPLRPVGGLQANA